MSNLCGVWYRAGGCILPFRHDGLHLTQEQDECNRVRAQVDELTAANTALSERLAAVTAALERLTFALDHQRWEKVLTAKTKALEVLAAGQPAPAADGDPYLPPLDSFDVEMEITEVRRGEPRVYESDFDVPAVEDRSLAEYCLCGHWGYAHAHAGVNECSSDRPDGLMPCPCQAFEPAAATARDDDGEG